MTEPSPDIAFAYAQLGLSPGASLDEIQAVLANASAYRFSTKSRIAHVRALTNFFAAREKILSFDAPFADIRKAYHAHVKTLHPDRNISNRATDDRLKAIIAAFAQIEAIHKQAKAYYKQPEDIRQKIEQEARAETLKENPAKPKPRTYAKAKAADAAQAAKPTASAGSRTYFAAALPRPVRTSRLSYLPPRVIIGSKVTPKSNDLNLIFDIIMLPEDQFLRAKSYLAAPEAMNAALTYGKFSPAYILKNIKKITIPANTPDPENVAKDYFTKEFGL